MVLGEENERQGGCRQYQGFAFSAKNLVVSLQGRKALGGGSSRVPRKDNGSVFRVAKGPWVASLCERAARLAVSECAWFGDDSTHLLSETSGKPMKPRINM